MSESEGKTPPSSRSPIRRLASLARWLHVYVSMLGLLVLLFFAVTGVVMNHPDWFLSGEPVTHEQSGSMDVGLLNLAAPESKTNTEPQQPAGDMADSASPDDVQPDDAQPDYTKCIDQLAVVELLRAKHGIKGAVSEFWADEYQCMVSFEAPGYSADAFIERSDGTYVVVETFDGLVAAIGDLHKGVHCGEAWPWVIDVAGIVLIVSALTGLFLLLAFQKRRRSGLLAMVLGGATIVAIYVLLVP